MSKLLKSLFAASAFLTLAPMTASAVPPSCWNCGCSSSCGQLCDNDGEVTTCGALGICRDVCLTTPSDTTASVTAEEAEEAQVCEESQQAEASAAAEG